MLLFSPTIKATPHIPPTRGYVDVYRYLWKEGGDGGPRTEARYGRMLSLQENFFYLDKKTDAKTEALLLMNDYISTS